MVVLASVRGVWFMKMSGDGLRLWGGEERVANWDWEWKDEEEEAVGGAVAPAVVSSPSEWTMV